MGTIEILVQRDALLEFARAHEKWEAALVTDGDWGPDGMSPFPRLTQALFDEAMRLQAMRNKALGK